MGTVNLFFRHVDTEPRYIEVYIDQNHYVVGRISHFSDGYLFQADTRNGHFFTEQELVQISDFIKELNGMFDDSK